MPATVLYRRPRYLAAVFVGGALGTGLRWLAGHVVHPGVWPWATLLVNLVGAFVLGVLTEATLRRGPEAGGLIRALFGVGMCGGLTTYSTLALDAATARSAGQGIAYVATSVLGGLVAAGLGVALGRGRA